MRLWVDVALLLMLAAIAVALLANAVFGLLDFP